MLDVCCPASKMLPVACAAFAFAILQEGVVRLVVAAAVRAKAGSCRRCSTSRRVDVHAGRIGAEAERRFARLRGAPIARRRLLDTRNPNNIEIQREVLAGGGSNIGVAGAAANHSASGFPIAHAR